jgi:hypothetical protein
MTVASATGALFVVVVITGLVVTGHYPRTGDTRLAVCVAAVIGGVVAVVGAARVFPALGHEPAGTRLMATVFVGFLFGALALGALFIVGVVAFAILLSRAHTIGVGY